RADENEKPIRCAPVDDSVDHDYLATTVNCLEPTRWPPRATVTVASHRPAIITWPVPRYTPPPAGTSFTSFLIAGMFIVGIAAMKNCTLTSAPSTGLPEASFTVASSWFSPAFGGSG